jgi:hypothetical protein
VEFFNGGQGGLFNLCFYGCSAAATNPFEGFAFSGGAVYTGTEAAPTFQTPASNCAHAIKQAIDQRGGSISTCQPDSSWCVCSNAVM